MTNSTNESDNCSMNKKWLTAGIISATVIVSVGATVLLMPQPSRSEIQPPYITDINDTLANHDARITNNTSDIAGLQTATGTAPSAQVAVPVPAKATPTPVPAEAPAPSVAPTPEPLHITEFYQRNHYDCAGVMTVAYLVKMSDGTSYETATRPSSGVLRGGGGASTDVCGMP